MEKLCEIIVLFFVDFEIPKCLKNDAKIDAEKRSKIELFFGIILVWILRFFSI